MASFWVVLVLTVFVIAQVNARVLQPSDINPNGVQNDETELHAGNLLAAESPSSLASLNLGAEFLSLIDSSLTNYVYINSSFIGHVFEYEGKYQIAQKYSMIKMHKQHTASKEGVYVLEDKALGMSIPSSPYFPADFIVVFRFAVAFHGSSSAPRLVALIAQARCCGVQHVPSN
ncbi:hypothetical protein ACFE04_008874 [Oxalis oulophora]